MRLYKPKQIQTKDNRRLSTIVRQIFKIGLHHSNCEQGCAFLVSKIEPVTFKKDLELEKIIDGAPRPWKRLIKMLFAKAQFNLLFKKKLRTKND